jgi:hypothetical protein
MTAHRKSSKRQESFAAGVSRGMRRAARTVRKAARRFGTPIYVWTNTKVSARDPNQIRNYGPPGSLAGCFVSLHPRTRTKPYARDLRRGNR